MIRKKPALFLIKKKTESQRLLKPTVNRRLLRERREKQQKLNETLSFALKLKAGDFKARKPKPWELKNGAWIVCDFSRDGKSKAIGLITDSFQRDRRKFLMVKAVFVTDLKQEREFRKMKGESHLSVLAENVLLVESN